MTGATPDGNLAPPTTTTTNDDPPAAHDGRRRTKRRHRQPPALLRASHGTVRSELTCPASAAPCPRGDDPPSASMTARAMAAAASAVMGRMRSEYTHKYTADTAVLTGSTADPTSGGIEPDEGGDNGGSPPALPELILATAPKSPDQPAGLTLQLRDKLLSGSGHSSGSSAKPQPKPPAQPLGTPPAAGPPAAGGVVVSHVSPQSPFHPRHALRPRDALFPGDEVLTINGHRVKDPKRAARMIRAANAGYLKVLVSRGERAPGTSYHLARVGNGGVANGAATGGANGGANGGDARRGEDKLDQQGRSRWKEVKDGSTTNDGEGEGNNNACGVAFRTASDNLVRVNSVGEASPFRKTGLQAGDVVLSVDGVPVRTAREAEDLLNGIRNGSPGGTRGGTREDGSLSRSFAQSFRSGPDGSRVVALLVYSLWDMRRRVVREKLFPEDASLTGAAAGEAGEEGIGARIEKLRHLWQVAWSCERGPHRAEEGREFAMLRIPNTTVTFRLDFDPEGTCSCASPCAALATVGRGNDEEEGEDEEGSVGSDPSIDEARAALELLYRKHIQPVVDALNCRTWNRTRLLAAAVAAGRREGASAATVASKQRRATPEEGEGPPPQHHYPMNPQVDEDCSPPRSADDDRSSLPPTASASTSTAVPSPATVEPSRASAAASDVDAASTPADDAAPPDANDAPPAPEPAEPPGERMAGKSYHIKNVPAESHPARPKEEKEPPRRLRRGGPPPNPPAARASFKRGTSASLSPPRVHPQPQTTRKATTPQPRRSGDLGASSDDDDDSTASFPWEPPFAGEERRPAGDPGPPPPPYRRRNSSLNRRTQKGSSVEQRTRPMTESATTGGETTEGGDGETVEGSLESVHSALGGLPRDSLNLVKMAQAQELDGFQESLERVRIPPLAPRGAATPATMAARVNEQNGLGENGKYERFPEASKPRIPVASSMAPVAEERPAPSPPPEAGTPFRSTNNVRRKPAGLMRRPSVVPVYAKRRRSAGTVMSALTESDSSDSETSTTSSDYSSSSYDTSSGEEGADEDPPRPEKPAHAPRHRQPRRDTAPPVPASSATDLVVYDPAAAANRERRRSAPAIKPPHRHRRHKPHRLKMRNADIRHRYKVLPAILGEGAFGTVRPCFHRGTHERLAVKSILKRGNVKNATLLKNEIALVQRVNHPNVVRVHDVIQDREYIHIVMEECRGGDLFDKIVEGGVRLTEARACEIVGCLLDAIAYLHDRDIVHRDLKAEHIMLAGDTIHSPVKIIDFGLATTHGPDDPPMTAFAGSAFTVAPEVIARNYGRECDLWSVGVIAYFLLTQKMPFNARSDDDIFRKIAACRYGYPPWTERGLSDEAKDFIDRLLVVDPRRRLTARQALSHLWIRRHGRARREAASHALELALVPVEEEDKAIVVRNPQQPRRTRERRDNGRRRPEERTRSNGRRTNAARRGARPVGGRSPQPPGGGAISRRIRTGR